MKVQKMKKSVEINASREKVWEVMHKDQFTRVWYNAFGEVGAVRGNWDKGSKIGFTDKSGTGLLGRVTENKPGEIIDIEFEGVMEKGAEIYDNQEAKALKGCHETYTFSGSNGTTTLSVAIDMAESYFDAMSKSWDKALENIKELSEANR